MNEVRAETEEKVSQTMALKSLRGGNRATVTANNTTGPNTNSFGHTTSSTYQFAQMNKGNPIGPDSILASSGLLARMDEARKNFRSLSLNRIREAIEKIIEASHRVSACLNEEEFGDIKVDKAYLPGGETLAVTGSSSLDFKIGGGRKNNDVNSSDTTGVNARGTSSSSSSTTKSQSSSYQELYPVTHILEVFLEQVRFLFSPTGSTGTGVAVIPTLYMRDPVLIKSA